MNDEQRKQTAILIESHRRALQILQNEAAMEGIYESLAAVVRGERGTPGKDLKRKYKRE